MVGNYHFGFIKKEHHSTVLWTEIIFVLKKALEKKITNKNLYLNAPKPG